MILYFAAALFSSRETTFNLLLAKQLEKLGYRVILPQRDGFEFARLGEALSTQLPEVIAEEALQIIIYLLDIGYFVSKCDIVVANLDEPVDEGMVTEMVYGRFLEKPVVSFRTDVRSPYGSLADVFGGGHFFPALQSDIHVKHYIPARTFDELETDIAGLACKLRDAANAGLEPVSNNVVIPASALNLVAEAEYLFAGIDDLHSDAGIKEVVERYKKEEDRLRKIVPKILS